MFRSSIKLASHRSDFVVHNNAKITSSRSRYGSHFHDRARAGAVALYDKLARVEGTKRRPMAHTEHGRPREPLAHQPVEAALRSLIHRRGRLIEEEPIRLLNERASKGDASLFARGKSKRPMAGRVEPLGQFR